MTTRKITARSYRAAIHMVATDVDDCIAPHPRYGKRDLSTAYEAREIIERHPGVYWSALTGQDRKTALEVVKAAGIGGLCAWEMGYLIGRPDEEPQLALSSAPEIYALRSLKERLVKDGVAHRAKKYGLDADIIREKEEMLSFRVGNERGEEFVKKVLPELLDEATRKYIESDSIEILNPKYAVDLKPKCIGKGHALKEIMKRAGKTGDILVIVDSGHSDKEMVEVAREKCGYVACPANATPDIKDLVAGFGERGYISEKPCAEGGFADILRYAEGSWGFV